MGDSRKNKVLKSLFWFLIIAVPLTFYHLLFINRYLPITAGWDLSTISLLDEGKMIYRDFTYYLPPGSFLTDVFLYKIVGGQFLYYRYIGLLLRIIMIYFLFLIYRRFFSERYSYIGVMASGVMLSTSATDFLGDYNQGYTFLLVLAAFFYICSIENSNAKKSELYIFICGILCGLLFLYKQSIGVIAPAYFICGLLIIFFNKREVCLIKKVLLYLLGICIPIGICFGWLISNHAFSEFVIQVFKTSAKGNQGNILFGALINIFKNNMVLLFLTKLLIDSVVFFELAIRKDKEKKDYNFIISYGITSVILLCIVFLNDMGSSFYEFAYAVLHTEYIIIFVMLLMSFILMVWLYRTKIIQENVKNISKILILVFDICIGFILIYNCSSNTREIIKNALQIYNLERKIPYILFWVSLYLIIKEFVYLIRNFKPKVSFSYIALIGVGLIFMYESCMVSPIGFGVRSGFISLPLIVGICFTKFEYIRLKNIILYHLLILFMLICLTQKLVVPYSWWGWKDDSVSSSNTYNVNVKGLEGYRVSLRTKNMYEQVVKLIDKNSDEGDSVFGFPHVKIFNVLSNRPDAHVSTPILFFDVCSDDLAKQVAKELENDPPKIVVWCDVGEDCWTTHETFYRNGMRSGQRDIQDWFENSKDTEYTQIGQIENLSIYRLNDDVSGGKN